MPAMMRHSARCSAVNRWHHGAVHCTWAMRYASDTRSSSVRSWVLSGKARSVPASRTAGVARSLTAPWTWRPVGKAATPRRRTPNSSASAQLYAAHSGVGRPPADVSAGSCRERHGADTCARLMPMEHRNTLRSATDRPGTTILSTMATRMTPFAAPSARRRKARGPRGPCHGGHLAAHPSSTAWARLVGRPPRAECAARRTPMGRR